MRFFIQFDNFQLGPFVRFEDADWHWRIVLHRRGKVVEG